VKLKITKKQMLKAVQTETLVPGWWIGYSKDMNRRSKKCEVCAVGAVMRHALPRASDGRVEEAAMSATYSASGEIPLRQLSQYFGSVLKRRASSRIDSPASYQPKMA
jgi:hypothetical protein